MKHIIVNGFTAFLVFFLVAGLDKKLAAQTSPKALKVNVLAPIVRTFNIAYEQGFAGDSNTTWQVAFGYTGFKDEAVLNDNPYGYDEKFRAVRIVPEVRYYFKPLTKMNGWFLSGYMPVNIATDYLVDAHWNFGSLNLGYVESKYQLVGIGLGAGLGYARTFSTHWVVEGFLGTEGNFGGYKRVSMDKNIDERLIPYRSKPSSLTGFGLRWVLNVGYRF